MLSHKKTLLGGFAALTLVWIAQTYGTDELALGVQKAFAETKPTDNIFTSMTGFLSFFITMLNTLAFIVYPILIAVVDPRFYLGIHQANEATILRIWQISRDIMNVIFAFMLITGACMTVVTAKKDIISRFAIKFVLGIILVNFSWFFPRVILDVAHVFAATVYQLPSVVSTTCSYYDVNGNIQSPCKYPYDFKFFDEAKAIHDANPAAAGYKCPMTIVCFKEDNLNNNTNTATGILAGLIMNHAHLPSLALVQNFNGGGAPATDPADQIAFFIMFLVNTGFLVFLSFALLLVMIAMLVAFVIRIPVLWITMAFMPLMFIGFVVGELMGNFNSMKIFKHFVTAAFLPAITAIPLAMGFIVINALAFTAPPAGLPPGMADLLKPLAPQGRFLPGVDNLWVLLWMITSILIIWKGFFAALKIDSIYAGATEGIQKFGSNIAGLVTSLPLNIPIIPAARDSAGNVTRPALSLGQAAQLPGQLGQLSRSGRLNPDAVRNVLNPGRTNTADTNRVAQDIGSNSGDVNRIVRAIESGDQRQVVAALNNISSKLGNLSPEQQRAALEEALRRAGTTLNPTQVQTLVNGINARTGAGGLPGGANPPQAQPPPRPNPPPAPPPTPGS